MTQFQDSSQFDEERIPAEDFTQNNSPETSQRQNVPEGRNWRYWGIVFSLMYANFWISSSVSLQAPFFPSEAERKGASPTQYGFVFGIYEVATIIMSVVFGKMMSKVSVKFILIFGALLGGASLCLFGLLEYFPAGNAFIYTAFVIRLLEGSGAAAVMTASYTITASVSPENIGTTFSIVETAFGFGLLVGPAVGGALYQLGGFMLPFAVNGGCLFLGYFLWHFLPKIEDPGRQEGSISMYKFLADIGIFCYAVSIVSSLLFMGYNAATLEPHLRQFKLQPVELGAVFIITGGLYAVTTPLWSRVCGRGLDPLAINLIGYILTCTGIIFLGPAPFIPFSTSLGSVIGCLILIGLGLSAKIFASFIGSLRNTAERGLPDNLATYGIVSAFFSTCASAGALIGPTLGGFLLDHIGYNMGTVVIFAIELCSMFSVILCILIKWLKNRRLSKISSERDPIIRHSAFKYNNYSSL